MEFFPSERIDNFQGEKYRILEEVLGAMNIHPEAVLLTDASHLSDFLWGVDYGDGDGFSSYQEEFDYRFDQLVDKVIMLFDVDLVIDGGQKTIVELVDEIYELRNR